MTPGYSLVQGSLSNFSGPYFLHATAKRSEIETISCQRSSWETQTQQSETVWGSSRTDSTSNQYRQLLSPQTHWLTLSGPRWKERASFYLVKEVLVWRRVNGRGGEALQQEAKKWFQLHSSANIHCNPMINMWKLIIIMWNDLLGASHLLQDVCITAATRTQWIKDWSGSSPITHPHVCCMYVAMESSGRWYKVSLVSSVIKWLAGWLTGQVSVQPSMVYRKLGPGKSSLLTLSWSQLQPRSSMATGTRPETVGLETSSGMVGL